MNWYYADGGRQVGPVDESALDSLLATGVVRDDTLVWREGMPTWQPHAAVRGARPAAPNPVMAPPAAEMRYCGECGRPYPAYELAAIGGVSVCAACKPVYMQRMREGGQAIGGMRYAGFWIRFVARIIDGVLLGIVGAMIRLPLMGVMGFGPRGIGSLAMVPMMVGLLGITTLLSVAIAVAYEVYFVSTRGATVGKMVMGLKIVRADGSPVSAGLAAGRYFAQWISAFIFMIGYIMAGFDEQKRALHDRICETRVIYAR